MRLIVGHSGRDCSRGRAAPMGLGTLLPSSTQGFRPGLYYDAPMALTIWDSRASVFPTLFSSQLTGDHHHRRERRAFYSLELG